MKRKIIKIDESKCDGCGECVPNCHEGALQIIDGKARLISDLFCDGLGACIGHCPQGALTIEEREAEPYDEKKVMDYIVKGGENVIKAHLEHLYEHGEKEFLRQAVEYLDENGIPLPDLDIERKTSNGGGCPGSQSVSFETEVTKEEGKRISHLSQWPIQLHLINPNAGNFNNADLLLAADCCGFTYPDFHKDFLKGKQLAIACPKLDTNKQVYLDKLIKMIDESQLESITVMIMQVPCCSGLIQLVQQAVEHSERKIPVYAYVIGIKGDILKEGKVA
jgi:ferredoxin